MEVAGVSCWSRTHKSRAMSSGGMEDYALVTGGAEGLVMKAVAENMGGRGRSADVDGQYRGKVGSK